MSRVPVIWIGQREGCWDQHLVNRLLSGPAFFHLERNDVPPVLTVNGRTSGAVLVVPARYHDAQQINLWLSRLPWAVLVATSDEEATLVPQDLAETVTGERVRWFVMTPDHRRGLFGGVPIGEGPPPGTTEAVGNAGPDGRDLHVTFAGQVTHERRRALLEAMDRLPAHWRPLLLPTEAFLAGVPRDEYLALLRRTRVAPCPAGPATPDSFRLYEACEAGCAPIVDASCDRLGGELGWWSMMYPEGMPFPQVKDWRTELAKTAAPLLEDWPWSGARARAWWLQRKACLGRQLIDAVNQVCDEHQRIEPAPFTTLVTVSPTSRPDRQAEILATTIASVRERSPDTPMVIVCDGVRPEQAHLARSYGQLVHWITGASRDWRAVPLVLNEWRHQALAARAALSMVRTSALLFMEQDTPLEGDVPLDACAALVRTGQYDLVRFHHESEILEPHRHLMLDRTSRAVEVPGEQWVPVRRTIQWSQRPHMAATARYRTWLATYFGSESRTCIEDVMHGVVQNAWHAHGEPGWEQFRLAMFAPHGNMRRSYHLDGRGDDEHYPMRFAYDGPTPEGAPAPNWTMDALRRGEP